MQAYRIKCAAASWFPNHFLCFRLLAPMAQLYSDHVTHSTASDNCKCFILEICNVYNVKVKKLNKQGAEGCDFCWSFWRAICFYEWCNMAASYNDSGDTTGTRFAEWISQCWGGVIFILRILALALIKPKAV